MKDSQRIKKKRFKKLETLEECAAESTRKAAVYKTPMNGDLLEKVLNSLNDMVFVKDRYHRWVYLNDACCRFWKCRREKLIGKSDYDYFPKEQADVYWAKDEEVLRTKKPNFNIEEQTIQGELHTIATMKSYYKEDRTGLEYIVGTIRDVTDHLKADAMLRESEEKFRNLADSSPNMIFINCGGKVVYANRKCEDVMGYKREEFLSPDFDFLSIIAPESQETVITAFRKHGREEEVLPYEYGIITREGFRIDAIITTKLINFEGERAIMGIVTDISDLKRSEEKLRDSEERYRNLLELAPIGIVTVDLKGKILSVNSAFHEISGYPPEEIEGKHFTKVPTLFPRNVPGFIKLFNNMMMGKNPGPVRFRYRRKDGSARWAEAHNGFIIEGGKKTGIQTIVQDITGQHEYEENLRTSELLYRSTINSLGDAIYMVNRDLRIIFYNQTTKEWNREHGYASEFQGKLLKEVYDFLNADMYSEYEQVFKTGKLLITEEEYIIKDRRIITETRKIPIVEHGKVTKVLTVIRDITEQKRAVQALKESEEMLRQAQKMEAIGRLAGGVAHDFNNLLTAILGYTDILRLNSTLGENEEMYVGEIKRSAERAALLTQRLLAFSRKQVLQPKVLNLNTLIRNLQTMLIRIIGEDIHLMTKLHHRLENVKADPGQIENVIVNLVVNARDAMPKGGTITIETGNEYLTDRYCHLGQRVPEGEYVYFSVQDTGAGIDEKISQQIFEPFFTTKEKGKGTGLGLSTVYGIVNQSRGYIFFDSTVGKGTSFKVTFPMLHEKRSDEQEDVIKERPAGGCETILVVEDEEMVRKMIASSLKTFGYTLIEAESATEALPKYSRDGIDLVITDVIMPGMSGSDLVNRLKSTHGEIKVLYMSGYTDDAIGKHGVLDEGIFFLQKPFTPIQLAAKVREILDQK